MLQKYNNPLINIILVFCLILTLNSCSLFDQSKKDDESIIKRKSPEPNVLKRVDARENIDKMQPLWSKSAKTQNLASENPIWLGSIKALEEIPLIQANYSSGIIITDWYSKDSSNESIKINIIFSSNEIKSSSFDVKSFKRTCVDNNKCSTITLKSDFNDAIKEKIIENARAIAITEAKKQ